MRYNDGRPPGLVITPATHPARFNDEELRLFEEGKCGWIIEMGNGRGIIYCERKSAPKTDFGNCQLHARALLDEGPAATNWRHAYEPDRQVADV